MMTELTCVQLLSLWIEFIKSLLGSLLLEESSIEICEINRPRTYDVANVIDSRKAIFC
uniref:Uncharacterized protein n=1 Tax=Rhizophora mucronata TaxID=61149 RepID=A0A2P2R0K7_RHIMU